MPLGQAVQAFTFFRRSLDETARQLSERNRLTPDEAAKARQICDWLAGLTDGLIVRTYRRLFDPEFGSFRDLS